VDSVFLSRMMRLLLVAGCVFSMRKAVLPLVVALPPTVVNLPPLTLVLLDFNNLLPEETCVPSSVVFSWGLFALPLVPFGFTGLAIPVVRVLDEVLFVIVVVVALARCWGVLCCHHRNPTVWCWSFFSTAFTQFSTHACGFFTVNRACCAIVSAPVFYQKVVLTTDGRSNSHSDLFCFHLQFFLTVFACFFGFFIIESQFLVQFQFVRCSNFLLSFLSQPSSLLDIESTGTAVVVPTLFQLQVVVSYLSLSSWSTSGHLDLVRKHTTRPG
jgi:hypothetical protein